MNRAAVALVTLLAVMVGVEAAIVDDGHSFPGMFALAGLVGGGVITAVAKVLGLVLQRPETPS